MATTTANQMESFTISIPSIDLKRLKGIAKAMGWRITKQEKTKENDSSEWTEEEEREAFLCTSRANAARMCAKYL